MTTFTFEAIGTQWQIDIYDKLAKKEEQAVFEKILKRIDLYDRTYSRFIPDSLITQMSKKAGTYSLPYDARKLFDVYHNLYTVTGGLFTPLIGQVLSDAGYDAEYSLREQTLHPPQKWEEVLDYHYPKLTLHEPALLDFGAAGKGYLIDIIEDILQGYGITSFCIDGSGDILYKSKDDKELRIGLEDPLNTDTILGVVSILNQSICASAPNRRTWNQYHHIMNPSSLSSPKHILATWVVADEAILADGLATALFLVSPPVLKRHYQFEYCILYPDYQVEMSRGFRCELY